RFIAHWSSSIGPECFCPIISQHTSATMFEEPNEPPAEDARTPAERANEKADEFRVHAQLAAVFEGPRKFDAQLLPNLDPELARDIQRTIAKLEKSKTPESPILPATSADDAARLLNLTQTKNL